MDDHLHTTLYKKDVKNSIRVWEIKVTCSSSSDRHAHATIHRKYGTIGGKLATSTRVINKGKNIGKINETSPLEQAVFEANSLITSALDSGYFRSPDAELDSTKKSFVFFPMLAQDFHKQAGKLKFPCYCQPKLDGIRLLLGKNLDGSMCINTRNGKPVSIDSFGCIASLASKHLSCGEFLDGEIYIHGTGFQTLTSMFKNGSTDLEYHVYDMYDVNRPSLTMSERLEEARRVITGCNNVKLILVDTGTITSHSDIDSMHERMVAQHYEGIMQRNAASIYEPGKRSHNLLKLKTFLTEEFTIVDVKEANGNDTGTAVFVCKVTGSGCIFAVRMKASRDERKCIWQTHLKDPKAYIGKHLTVQYQELTDSKIPRFPVGLAIRDYE